MRSLLLCAALTFAAYSQNRPNPFDKPPADVDDALRARVSEFYKLHMAEKYRLAEQLVAEDSKDGFYAASKPDIKDFKIGEIVYSEGYSKAKVTLVSKMLITMFGMSEARLMDVPFPSYWKIDGGKWCWYIFNDPNRMTPFGKVNTATTSGKGDGALAFKPVDLSTISNSLKPDRSSVELGDKEEKVVLSNILPGTLTLSLDQKEYVGLTAKLDKTTLAGGEKATLSLTAAKGRGKSRILVGVLVQPTNQLVQIEVK